MLHMNHGRATTRAGFSPHHAHAWGDTETRALHRHFSSQSPQLELSPLHPPPANYKCGVQSLPSQQLPAHPPHAVTFCHPSPRGGMQLSKAEPAHHIPTKEGNLFHTCWKCSSSRCCCFRQPERQKTLKKAVQVKNTTLSSNSSGAPCTETTLNCTNPQCSILAECSTYFSPSPQLSADQGRTSDTAHQGGDFIFLLQKHSTSSKHWRYCSCNHFTAFCRSPAKFEATNQEENKAETSNLQKGNIQIQCIHAQTA